jgi:hypothetical protein
MCFQDIYLYLEFLIEKKKRLKIFSKFLRLIQFFFIFIYLIKKRNFKSSYNFFLYRLEKDYQKKKYYFTIFDNNLRDFNISIDRCKKNFNNIKYNFFEFLIYYKYFLMYSDLVVAANLRKKIIQELYKELSFKKYLFKIHLNSIIENIIYQEDSNFEKEILFFKKKFICEKDIFKQFYNFFLIINKKRTAQHTINRDDIEYFNLIKHKSISIVGPADLNYDNGETIDSFDLVVRPIYNANQSLNQNFYGKRTDISYYNFGFISQFPKKIKHASKILKFINLKVKDQKVYEKNKNYRIFKLIDPFYFNGSGNSIPNIVFDLMFFSPRKIKIFNSTLYLGKSLYGKDFQIYNSRKLNREKLLYKIRIHDPLSQFIFLKTIWLKKLIFFDNFGSNVIKKTVNEYATELQNPELK